MTSRARSVRLVLAAALVVLLAAAGAGYALTRHTGRTATKTATSASPARYAGAITVLWPGGWPTPGWPITIGFFSGNLWDSLVEYRPDGTFFPELASVVPTQANGGLRIVNNQTVITYQLKPNLRWSDGSPITPADYIAEALVGSAPEMQTYGMISTTFCPGIHAMRISGSTLVVTLDGVESEALDLCYFTPGPWEYLQRKYHITVPAGMTASFDGTRAAAMYAAPSYQGSPLQRLIAKLENDPYTSPGDLFNGPYRMTSWSKGGAGVEVPNPYFTALPPDPHHPRPAQIRLVTLPGDYPTGARAILQGTIPANADVAFVGRDQIPSGFSPPLPLQAHPPRRLMLVPQNPEVLMLNVERPALRDKRVRQALVYAIDKIAFLRQLGPMSAAQAAAIADTSPFGHRTRFSIADQLPANLYNPAKARALLAAAGYATAAAGPGRHVRLDLYVTTDPIRDRGDEILQRMWRQVGIDVRLHFVNQRGSGGIFSSYANGGIIARGAFDLVELRWSANRDDGGDYLGDFDPGQIPDRNHPNGNNDGRVRDRALFSLLDQAQRTFDDATRQRLYARFQRAMVDQAYWIPLFDNTEPVWVKPTIGNFNPYGGPFGAFDFTNFFWNSYQWYLK